MSKISKYLYFTVCFVFFLLGILYFSDIIVSNLLNGFTYSNEYISLNYIENTGAAFNILKDARELLIIVSVIAICLIISYIICHISKISTKTIFFLALLSAGIGGNLHERIALGFVRDYIQLNFIDFPVFNISDIVINISVLAIIILLLRNK